jgi:hypothetical protein
MRSPFCSGRHFEALSSHYLFESCFCRPRTGHDKGGVESRGRAIRWQHLVPIPRGDDLGVMCSALLARLDAEHDATRFTAEPMTNSTSPSATRSMGALRSSNTAISLGCAVKTARCA